MTRGSCLTFQLQTPSRQQSHPRFDRNWDQASAGAQEPLPRLRWSGSARPGMELWRGCTGPDRTGGSPALLASAASSLSAASGSLVGTEHLASCPWDSGRVSRSCTSSLLPGMLGPPGRQGFPKKLVHPLQDMGPLLAQSHTGRLSPQLRKDHFKQSALEQGQEDAPLSCFPSKQQCPRVHFPSLEHFNPAPTCSVG